MKKVDIYIFQPVNYNLYKNIRETLPIQVSILEEQNILA